MQSRMKWASAAMMAASGSAHANDFVESVDFPGSGTLSSIPLDMGTNSITGTINGPDFDCFAFEVPGGGVLSAVRFELGSDNGANFGTGWALHTGNDAYAGTQIENSSGVSAPGVYAYTMLPQPAGVYHMAQIGLTNAGPTVEYTFTLRVVPAPAAPGAFALTALVATRRWR